MTSEMRFVKVLVDTPEQRQALFEYDGRHFVYSYVNNNHAHETMVFESNSEGEISLYVDLAMSPEYASSKEIMQHVVDKLNRDATISETEGVSHD